MPLPQKIGRYDVLAELGRGGMGAVYRAFDPGLKREVALKLIDARLVDEETRERFLIEARAGSQVLHPNVVPVLDAGEDRGRPYLVMELVEGESLEARLKRGHAREPPQAPRVSEAIAWGIARAHELGIVHRDLKPENVMLTREGTPRLTDFGLAKITASHLTQTGQVLGTPGYLSPEAASGARPGAAADVYGLGGLLYALLSGRPPTPGASVLAALVAAAEGRIEPLHELCPQVDSTLIAICERAMVRDPKARPAAREFATELREWRGAREGGSALAASPRRRALPALVATAALAAGVGGFVAAQVEVERSPALATASPTPGPVDKAEQLAAASPAATPAPASELDVQTLRDHVDAYELRQARALIARHGGSTAVEVEAAWLATLEGRHDEGAERLTRALERADVPRGRALQFLARTELYRASEREDGARHRERAEALLVRATQVEPEVASHWGWLGGIREGGEGQGEVEYANARRIDPAERTLTLARLRRSLRAGRFAEAKAIYLEAIRARPQDVELLSQGATIYRVLRDPRRRAEALERLVGVLPRRESLARCARALLDLAGGCPEDTEPRRDALARAEKVLERLDADQPPTLELRGWWRSLRGEWERGALELREARRASPSVSATRYYYATRISFAESLLREARYAELDRELQSADAELAAESWPSAAARRAHLAVLGHARRAKQGARAKAIEGLSALITRAEGAGREAVSPDVAQAWHRALRRALLARALLHLDENEISNRMADAKRAFADLEHLYSLRQDPRYLPWIAVALYRLGDPKRAKVPLEEGGLQSPRVEALRLGLLAALEHRRPPLKELGPVLKTRDPRVARVVGRTLFAGMRGAENDREARHYFEALQPMLEGALSRTPRDAALRLERNTLMLLGRELKGLPESPSAFAAALKESQLAVEHEPKLVAGWVQCGELKAKLGDRAGALADYRKAQSLAEAGSEHFERIQARVAELSEE